MRLQTTPLLLEPVEEKAVTAPWDSCARQSPDLVPEAPSWDGAAGSIGPGRCLRGWAVAEKNIGRAGPTGSMIGMPSISSSKMQRHNVLACQIRIRRRKVCPLQPCKSIGIRMSIRKMLIVQCHCCETPQPSGFAHSACAGSPVCRSRHPVPSATPCVTA